MVVPFLNLKAQHTPFKAEFASAIQEVIDTGAFAGGPFVTKFEDEFAAYCECRYAIGLGSGTDALWLTLLALGVGPGDEVITVPNSFMATAEAISYCGAKPVFVDVDERAHTMNPVTLAKAINLHTKAIIPVQLFGQPADMDSILQIAREHMLPVVEDACQAHGARYQGKRCGTLGIAGSFSFYPGKNLGAFGEAGAVTTNDDDLAQKIRVLRDHGQIRKYHHTMIGWNCRMDGIQGAVLSIKLCQLERGNDLRRAHAAHYHEGFAEMSEIITPAEMPYARHVYHLYPIRVQNRDRVMRSLEAKGIGCGIHYPIPIHLQEAYRSLGHQRGDFPIAERAASEFLSLPMFPELSYPDVEDVIAAVKKAIAEAARN